MPNIERPDMTLLWANEGAILEPTDEKKIQGWTAEIPPHQWENWAQNRQDVALAYLLQKGIPEWAEDQEYYANVSFTQHNNILYKALKDNTGSEPSDTNEDWLELIFYSDDIEQDLHTYTDNAAAQALQSAKEYADEGLSEKADLTDPRFSDAREWTAETVGQQEAEEGTSSTRRAWTSQRVRQAIAAFAAPLSRKITTGSGLTGGGDLSSDLSLSIDFGDAEGTVVEGNDPRLSDAREWISPTVTKEEAEEGTSEDRRAWSAHRVREAILGWWGSVGTLFGKSLLSLENAEAGRTTLELGTAATSDLVQETGQSDTLVMSQKAVTDAISSGGGGGIGVGQTWQDVSSSRAANTTYTNTTGKPIMAVVSIRTAKMNFTATFSVDGRTTYWSHAGANVGIVDAFSIIIPNGSSYSCTHFDIWLELR